MDNRRLFLLVALGAVLFFMWQAWQRDYPQQGQQAPAVTQRQASPQKASPKQNGAAAGVQGEIPSVENGANKSAGQAQSPSSPLSKPSQTIHVTTDVVKGEIDARGGTLRRLTLLHYPVSPDHPNQPYNLLNDTLPYLFIAQSGLTAQSGPAPTHHAHFQAQQTDYRLAEGKNTLQVPLVWQGPDGRKVTKTYIFHRGSYEVDVRYHVDNGAAQPWKVSPYIQFWRTPESPVKNPRFLSSFTGAAVYKEKGSSDSYKYSELGFGDLSSSPFQETQKDGWIAMVQHYFVAAAIPAKNETVRYFAKSRPLPGGDQKAYVDGYVGSMQTVAPGAQATLSTRLYIGPKLQDVLPHIAPGLDLTVNYGIWTVAAQPIFWFLEKIHNVVGNWGWAIIILTLIIKLLFFKLTETQYKSMARMRKFGPRIQQLKERHKDDREAMQKAMMDLYKKEGFNPLGGCWPMLVQFPVFIALYEVLRASVELRHAPWILWIHDLSAPDPYYILPVLYGVVMFAQQKLSGSTMTMDETQRKLMMVMPLGLAVFFAFFPAGLVLYWLTSVLISVTQQWLIMRKVEHDDAKKRRG